MNIPRENRICGNCQHWDIFHATYAPIHLNDGRVNYMRMAPCLINAVEPDAGKAVVYLSCDGHCRYHQDAWEEFKDWPDDSASLPTCPEVSFMRAAC